MAGIKLTNIVEFEWDEANVAHIAKHNVIPQEAEEVFFDKNNIRYEDVKHSISENRFLIIGKTKRRWNCMKKKLAVPKFKNEAEEANFWASLDLSEYFEPSDFKRGVMFPNLKRSKRLISIRLPEDLISKVKEKASKKDVPYQSLIREYIQQGVVR